jgi:hypothetical protein
MAKRRMKSWKNIARPDFAIVLDAALAAVCEEVRTGRSHGCLKSPVSHTAPIDRTYGTYAIYGLQTIVLGSNPGRFNK